MIQLVSHARTQSERSSGEMAKLDALRVRYIVCYTLLVNVGSLWLTKLVDELLISLRMTGPLTSLTFGIDLKAPLSPYKPIYQ